MVAAVHLARPGQRARRPARRSRLRVRAATMAAEGVLHDLGVIPMLTSDSQGMGRVGEVVRRALQNGRRHEGAARRRGRRGPADNERVLR